MGIGTSTLGRERAAGAAPDVWRLRWRVARLIARQELLDALYGWPFYVTAAIGLLLSALFVYNSLNFVSSSGLLILGRPFYVPMLAVTSLATLYLAAWATLAIARPRDLGGLRVLFFAPVDPIGLIAGHLLAGAGLAALLALVSAPLLWALALATNLPLPPQLLVGLLLSPIFGVLAVAIGLFISTIAPSSRAAMFFFGAIFLIVVAIPAGYTAMLSIPPSSRYYDALLFIRAALRTLRDLLNWASPFALLGASLDASLRGSWLELLQRVAVGIAETAAWGALAIWGFHRRGVLP